MDIIQLNKSWVSYVQVEINKHKIHYFEGKIFDRKNKKWNVILRRVLKKILKKIIKNCNFLILRFSSLFGNFSIQLKQNLIFHTQRILKNFFFRFRKR